MSNSTKKINVVSAQLVTFIRSVLRESCGTDKETGSPICVACNKVAAKVAKTYRKELPKSLLTNQQILYFLVNAAVNGGQCEGYRTRRGRNGGIYKDPSYKPVKRPEVKAAPEPETTPATA